MDLILLLIPELILLSAACVLFLMGISSQRVARQIAPVLALVALLVVFGMEVMRPPMVGPQVDSFNSIRITPFSSYIRMLASGVSVLFVLLAWPTNRQATGNTALEYGTEAGEFFSLLLLSVTGLMLVAAADDMIVLFLALELASIPTYIMVSISRPLAVAQEAGVKYFFLGAMSAAIMLFGFSYLYGTTGTTNLREITEILAATRALPGQTVLMTPWQMLAVLMLIAGFAFKIAAVPLHVYVGDVYQGAATPVTAMLAFIPKASGMAALIKLLFISGGGGFAVPETISRLLWIVAVLTMTVGNVLALIQIVNVKRVLAYSSVAHTGYMLVGLTALTFAATEGIALVQEQALSGVLFYLAAYGIMNAGAFGVLMLLPARAPDAHGFGRQTPFQPLPTASSAETYDDLAGQGRHRPALGLAMAVCCFSLIGLPLTVGFFGKVYLIWPALRGGNFWLVVITMINAAISAAYYLKIVGTMFLRPEPARAAAIASPTQSPGAVPTLAYAGAGGSERSEFRALPITLAVAISAVGTLLLGSILPATQVLKNTVTTAAEVDQRLHPQPQAAGTEPATVDLSR